MRLVFWAGFWAFITDQASKYLVVHVMNLAERLMVDVWPPFLVFHMAWNKGINFGLFADGSDAARYVLIGIALAICAFVLVWIQREPPGKWGMISAGLLVGGALGNVVDRLIYGAVADFINMSCCGFDNPFAFNLADAWIFVGALGLVVFGGDKREA